MSSNTSQAQSFCDVAPPPPDWCRNPPPSVFCRPTTSLRDMHCNPNHIHSYCLPGFFKSTAGNITKNNAPCVNKMAYNETRACCPGYYCPVAMSCLVPCQAKGSICPSSNTMKMQDECQPLGMPLFGPDLGCGGAWNGSVPCTAGNFCPDTSGAQIRCPSGEFCLTGVTSGQPCSIFLRCPGGTKDQLGNTIGVLTVSIVLLVLGSLLFWKKMKFCITGCHNKRLEVQALLESQSDMLVDDEDDTHLCPCCRKMSRLAREISRTNGSKTDALLPREETALHLLNTQTLPVGNTPFDRKLRMTMDIQFQDLTLQLKSSKVIVVDRVSGRIPAGTVTAIMGGSGAGKSSFLNTLSGKAKAYGEVLGRILLNGEERELSEFSDIVGFVPQDDIMNTSLTVREILQYNAACRLPASMPADKRNEIVNDVLEILGIDDISESIVGGDSLRRGISGGQRKRVNIGMELVTNPVVLFLDEPTSGLDATTSSVVMQVLRRVANRGTNVIVILHQPRYEIYKQFDNLLLLGRGGRIVYLGQTSEAERYFNELGYPRPALMNPADFVLDVVQGQIQNDHGTKSVTKLAQLWREQSDISVVIKQEWEDSSQNDWYQPRARQGFIYQTGLFFLRALLVLWRQRVIIVSDMFMTVVGGLIVGLNVDYTSINKVPTSVNMISLAISLVGTVLSLRMFGAEREVFWRESAAGINRFAYYVGSTLAASIWIVLTPLLFLSLFWAYAMPRANVMKYFGWIMLEFYCAQSCGQLLSVVFSPPTAQLSAVVLTLILMMLDGFNPSLSSYKGKPLNEAVISLSYPRWFVEALWSLEVNVWTDVFEVPINGQANLFGWSRDNSRDDALGLIFIGLGLRILTVVALFALNRDKQK